MQLIEACDLRDACRTGEVFPALLPKAEAFAEDKLAIGSWYARFKLPEGWVYCAAVEDDGVAG